MSAATKGRQIQQTEDELTKALRQGVTTHDAQPEDEAYGGVPAASFPRHFETGTQDWQKMTKLKQSLVTDPTTATTPFGQLQFSDNDARALLAQENAAKEASFDSWFGDHYQNADLPTRMLAQELNPAYYDKREALLVAKTKMALRIKMIQLRGPRSETDLQILYGLKSGDIRLEEGWDTIGFNQATQSDTGALLSDIGPATRLFVPLGRRGLQLGANNQADPRVMAYNTQPFANPGGPYASNFDAVRSSSTRNPVNELFGNLTATEI